MLFAPQSPGAIAYEILAKELRNENPRVETGVVHREENKSETNRYEAYQLPKKRELDGIKRIVESIKEEYAPETAEEKESTNKLDEYANFGTYELNKTSPLSHETMEETADRRRRTFAEALKSIQSEDIQSKDDNKDEIEDILRTVRPIADEISEIISEKEEEQLESSEPAPKVIFFFEN
jgi:hypothetical protein